MSKLLKTFPVLFAMCAAGPLYADTSVTVTVSNVSKSDTRIFISVFSDKKSWLKEPLLVHSLELSSDEDSGTATMEVTLPPGEYAFQVFHDLDDNGKMKTNLIGIPKEPVGVSNDAKGKFGPPKYKDAKILIGENAMVVPIVLNNI